MSIFQSTLESIRNNVIEKLRLDEDDDSALVDEWINLAYLEAMQVTGALQQTGSALITPGESSFTLPVQVAWIKHLVITYTDGTVSAPLQRIRLERMLVLRQGSTSVGQRILIPFYAISGMNQIELWPEPGSGESLQFWYAYLPEQLENNADEPVIQEPFGSKLLEYGALVEGARFKKDPMIMDYEAQYERWLYKFQTWVNRRQGASSQALEVWDQQPLVFHDAMWER